MLGEIDGDDLRNYSAYLRKYRTSTGKLYDDRSIYNHFLNVVTFLNAHGKSNLIEQQDWPGNLAAYVSVFWQHAHLMQEVRGLPQIPFPAPLS